MIYYTKAQISGDDIYHTLKEVSKQRKISTFPSTWFQSKTATYRELKNYVSDTYQHMFRRISLALITEIPDLASVVTQFELTQMEPLVSRRRTVRDIIEKADLLEVHTVVGLLMRRALWGAQSRDDVREQSLAYAMWPEMPFLTGQPAITALGSSDITFSTSRMPDEAIERSILAVSPGVHVDADSDDTPTAPKLTRDCNKDIAVGLFQSHQPRIVEMFAGLTDNATSCGPFLLVAPWWIEVGLFWRLMRRNRHIAGPYIQPPKKDESADSAKGASWFNWWIWLGQPVALRGVPADFFNLSRLSDDQARHVGLPDGDAVTSYCRTGSITEDVTQQIVEAYGDSKASETITSMKKRSRETFSVPVTSFASAFLAFADMPYVKSDAEFAADIARYCESAEFMPLRSLGDQFLTTLASLRRRFTVDYDRLWTTVISGSNKMYIRYRF